MDDVKETELDLMAPLPVETNTENAEADDADLGLIPLPIEEMTTESGTIPDSTSPVPTAAPTDAATELQQDIEMKDVSTEQSTEMVVEEEVEEEVMEEEEEGGIIEEEEVVEEESGEIGGVIEEVVEEEESGGIIAPPPGPLPIQPPPTAVSTQSQSTVNGDSTTNGTAAGTIPTTITTSTTTQPQKPQPKPSANGTTPNKEDADKDRARSHAITTDPSKPKHLNISLMSQWTNTEVLKWLTHRFGLWGQQYVPAFSNKKVDGAKLYQLTEQELKTEFGVTKPLHLVRMCRDIKDAQRPIHLINKLIAPCFMDGGNAASKMMRFGVDEVYKFAMKLPVLKMHAQTFKDRQINGRVLLECTDVQLVNAMRNEQVTLVDAQSILEMIAVIKKEDTLDRSKVSELEYLPIQRVYEVWSEVANVAERRFKLLPQHIRDYSKPAPTYYPPPQSAFTYSQRASPQQSAGNANYGGNQAYGGRGGGGAATANSMQSTPSRQYNASPVHHESYDSGTPPLWKVKDVMTWTTDDCVEWLGQIRESKVDLRVRYTPHFEQVRMTGKVLLMMTPDTLSSICCISTKTHLKQIVKALDKIRDHLIYKSFGSEPHVREFVQKYSGGFQFTPSRSTYTPRRRDIGADSPYDKSGSDAANAGPQPRYNTRGSGRKQSKPRTAQQQQANGGQAVQKGQAQVVKQQGEDNVAKCFVCQKTGNVMRCSQCKSAFYCSREHQVEDWVRHSKECAKLAAK